MRFSLEDRPPWPALLAYGLQWWVVTLPCVVVTGAVVSGLHYSEWADRVWYLQKLFAVTGLASLVQVTIGHRLPLVIGPATVLMVGLAASSYAAIGALYTAMALGGAMMAAIGFLNQLARVRRFFTTRIVAVILALIAFTLSPVILRLIVGQDPPGASLALALGLVVAMAALNEVLKGALKSLTLPLGLAAGAIICRLWLGSWSPEASTAKPAASGWLIEPSFQAGPILAFAFCFVALLINELGSVEAVGRQLSARGMDGRVRRGVGVAGASNVVSGLLGVIGSVDYSLSSGIIAATGNAARITLAPAALGLLACAFVPGLIAWLAAIPEPVMGAALLYVMVSQLAGALTMLVEARAAANYSQGVIIGLPLMAALIIAFAPAGVFESFPALLRPIAGNGFVVGTLLVMLLEHAVFRPGRGKRPKSDHRADPKER